MWRAPWWGGVFERMIQSMKRLLCKIIGTSKLTFNELLTAMNEVESLLNSHPLTFMSAVNSLNHSHPLTSFVAKGIWPYQMFWLKMKMSIHPVADKLTRRMKHLSHTIEGFWTHWQREYLLELRDSQKRSNPQGNSNRCVGDVVIIEDEKIPRGFWRLGTSIVWGWRSEGFTCEDTHKGWEISILETSCTEAVSTGDQWAPWAETQSIPSSEGIQCFDSINIWYTSPD